MRIPTYCTYCTYIFYENTYIELLLPHYALRAIDFFVKFLSFQNLTWYFCCQRGCPSLLCCLSSLYIPTSLSCPPPKYSHIFLNGHIYQHYIFLFTKSQLLSNSLPQEPTYILAQTWCKHILLHEYQTLPKEKDHNLR